MNVLAADLSLPYVVTHAFPDPATEQRLSHRRTVRLRSRLPPTEGNRQAWASGRAASRWPERAMELRASRVVGVCERVAGQLDSVIGNR
jgi:hypothetical protein